MRALVLLTLFLASGASAQRVSLGMGPATALNGPASYTELRGRFALTPLLSIEPTLGATVQEGSPGACSFYYLKTSCDSGYAESLSVGAALTIRAPEASLPRLLASAHVGLLGQWETTDYEEVDALRVGAELGADVHVSGGITVGAVLQASVRSGGPSRYACFGDEPSVLCRVSLAPMLRMGYAPEARGRHASGGTQRLRLSVASGVASGYRAGAVQSEMRASLPLGKVLAFEPSVAYTAVGGYDALPTCRPDQSCGESVRKRGDDAVSHGVGISAHSGRLRVSELSLADVYVGTSVHVDNPWSSESADSRLTLLAGAAVPIARGLALGVEVQAMSYASFSSSTTSFATYDGITTERGRFSFAPMLRLAVGGLASGARGRAQR